MEQRLALSLSTIPFKNAIHEQSSLRNKKSNIPAYFRSIIFKKPRQTAKNDVKACDFNFSIVVTLAGARVGFGASYSKNASACEYTCR